MRGHFISGTRKLNRHYQSGNGWKLIGASKKQWMIDRKVIKDGAVVGYIPYDGTPNQRDHIALRVGTQFKIVCDLPLYRRDVNGIAENISTLRGMTIGFPKLEYEKNGAKYYVNGVSNYVALAPAPLPLKLGLTLYLGSTVDNPIINFRYWCDDTYHTVYLEIDKIYDGYSNLVCYSNFAIPDYRGNSVYAYLNYFSETVLQEYGVKMYVKG